MSAPRDVDRLLNSFLREGPMELPDASYDQVRDRMENTRQRAVLGSWRTPNMNNNFVRVALAAAAVVVIAIIAINLLPGSPAPGGDPSVSPSVEPSAPSTPAGEEPSQTVIWNDALGVGNVAVTLRPSGWDVQANSGYATVTGYEDTGFLVYAGDLWIYSDPCAWSTTVPDTPATTVDEIIAALASQASRDASEPSDITVAGYAGRSITLHVPEDAVFADCDEDTFSTLTEDVEGSPDSEPHRWHQGPAQIDEFWVLDVGGRPMTLDLTYWPDTPQEVIDEIYAVVESVTFGE